MVSEIQIQIINKFGTAKPINTYLKAKDSLLKEVLIECNKPDLSLEYIYCTSAELNTELTFRTIFTILNYHSK